YYLSDQQAPSYRMLLFVAKQGGAPAVERAHDALRAPAQRATSDVDELQALVDLADRFLGLRAIPEEQKIAQLTSELSEMRNSFVEARDEAAHAHLVLRDT